MSHDELDAWLRLVHAPGVGRVHQRLALRAFGPPLCLFDATPAVRAEALGPDLARAIEAPPPGHAERVADTRRWLAKAPDDAPRTLLALDDPSYPPRLLEAPDPPLLLYVSGDVDVLKSPSLAVVGSRHATPQGLDHARDFSRALGERGLTIVSGLAAGIDAAAHGGALAGPSGTVAVVGTGLDRVYPRRHTALARRIERAGCVVSEYPLGADSIAFHFPQRNRIIAGLALGTLVVEAALASGSLITARLAAEAGREVFALPGSLHSPVARGCHGLIQRGAKLVGSVEDIVEELAGSWRPSLPGVRASSTATVTASRADARLLAAMGFDPVSLDMLAERTGLGAAALGARLLAFELEGRVARLPGGLLQRRGPA